jgi:hypothetical protein
MIKTSSALADLGDILTPADVQRFLGIGRNATYELLASGNLPKSSKGAGELFAPLLFF